MRHGIASFILAAALLASSPLAAAQKIAFVTSATGTGNLSSASWGSQIAAAGLDAADQRCQDAIDASGLDPLHNRTFRAWISDGSTDAYCHVQGFDGTIDDGCGGHDPDPTLAGPWVRMDGKVFARSLADLVLGEIFFPVLFDEHTATAPSSYWTGTRPQGDHTGFHCGDWASASSNDEGGTGVSDGGSYAWSLFNTSGTCDGERALLCLEAGTGTTVNPPRVAGRYAFLTTTQGNGNLSSWPQAVGKAGLAAGDAICQAEAAEQGLPFPTSFKAWLSDSTHDAASRLANDGSWIRVDGLQIATSLASLTDGHLAITIDMLADVTRAFQAGGAPTWTGSNFDGTRTTSTCSSWTDAGSSLGTAGLAERAGTTWASITADHCFTSRHLYCFSDAPARLLFADGIESGTTRLWAAQRP